MTHTSITSCDCRLRICRYRQGFGHCSRGLAGPLPVAHEVLAEGISLVDLEPVGEELDGSDTREEIPEALLELDGLDDDDPYPEYGDFWIDTDDVDAV